VFNNLRQAFSLCAECQMKLTRLGIAVTVCLILIGGWFALRWVREDVSGIYLATGPNAVSFLQLIETNEHHLTGLYEEITLKPDGTIERHSAPVTGDISAGNVLLSLRPLAPLPIDMTASGTASAGRIALTFGGFGVLTQATLVRSDMMTFQAKVAALTDLGSKIAALRAAAAARQQAAEAAAAARQEAAEMRARQVTEMRQFIQRAADAVKSLDDRAKSFQDWARHYQSITEQMRSYLDRQQQLPVILASSNARIQLSLTIDRDTLATEQLHRDIEGHHRAFAASRSEASKQLDGLHTLCRSAHESTPDQPVPLGEAEWNSTCLEALGVEPAVTERFNTVGSGYLNIEKVYQQEVSTQRQIAQTANRIANQ
jgi:hypothetical protein